MPSTTIADGPPTNGPIVENAEPKDSPDPASVKYLPYVDDDVSAVSRILSASSDFPSLSQILLADYADSTPQTFSAAQTALKTVLKEHLVDQDAGALRPERTRLANLIFQFQDARLILDSADNLPIFRPGPEDHPDRDSMSIALGKALVAAARAAPSKPLAISPKLFIQLLGLGEAGEVDSLRSVANMSASVRAAFDQTRDAARALFEAATDGTTVDQLNERKALLEARQNELDTSIQYEVDRKAEADHNLTNLNQVFRGLLEDSNLAEDLPDIAALVGGDFSALTIHALFDTVIDQFNRKAKQERAQTSAASLQDTLETQYLRASTLLQNNISDKDRITANMEDLQNRISQAEETIENAMSNKTTAEGDLSQANSDIRTCDMLSARYTSAGTYFQTAMNSSSVNARAFNSLAAIINCSALRTAVTNWVSAKSNLAWAQEHLDSANGTLRQRKTTASSKYSSWQRAVSYTRTKKSTYENTAAKIGSGKDEKDNPAKKWNYDAWQWAINDESNKKSQYNSAVNQRDSAQRTVNSRTSTRNSKRDIVNQRLRDKDTAERNFQKNLDDEVANNNENKIAAQRRRSESQTKVDGFQLTIERKTTEKEGYETELAAEESTLADTSDLISTIEAKVAEIAQQQLDADARVAAGTNVPEVPVDPTPAQESAAAIQLRDLMDRRNRLNDTIEKHAKRATELRAEAADVQTQLADTIDELASPPASRDERRKNAELEKKDTLQEAITKASEQLKAVLNFAGYNVEGTWAGVTGEAIPVPVLRLLVADVKAHTCNVEIRRRPPQKSYEQLPGSEISQTDIDSVERIVQKLQAALQENSGSLGSADAATLLQAAELQVRSEFSADLDVKPPSCILVNDCGPEGGAWENSILSKSTVTNMRLIFQCNAFYEARNASPDWMLLTSKLEDSSTPVEELMADLVDSATTEWALDACSRYLVESWLKHKSLKLAKIEDLGNLITKFEDLRANPVKSVTELGIFRQPTKSANDDPSFVVGKHLIDRILAIRAAVLELEKTIVDASEVDIISLAKSIQLSFERFNKTLAHRAIEFVSSEILRRKTAILAGDTAELGGAAIDEAAALESQIEGQQVAIDAAEERLQKLREDQQAALSDAQTSARIWETTKNNLTENIKTREASLTTKTAELTAVLQDHAATEAEILRHLQDTKKLREEINVLTSQRDQYQTKVDQARQAVAAAEQDLNRGEGELEVLGMKKGHLEATKQAAEEQLASLKEWMTFTGEIAKQLKQNHATIVQRSAMATEYKSLQGDQVKQQMFSLVGKYFPLLKADANKFAASIDSLKKLDLRQALDQHFIKFPSLDYQPKTSEAPGEFTLQGISLSYTEVEEALLAFVTQRCSRAGLEFGEDGIMKARDDSAIPSFESASIPLPVRELIKDRISRCYNPSITGALISWEEFLQRPYDQAAKTLTEMKSHCGISKMDVLRAYASTVNIVLANVFVIDKSAKLPGINLYVTAGEDIHVQASCEINTSPVAIQLREAKAKNGSDYVSNPTPNGRHGDDGLNAPPGFNAGHVTLNAHRKLSWDDSSLRIKAIGSVGVNGQAGGDGDKGRDGIRGKDGSPEDTDGWGNKQLSLAWTRYPGCDNDGGQSTQQSRINELSGPGGDGGQPGAGGQGGSGGEVILMDQVNPKVHILPESNRPASIGATSNQDNDRGTSSVQFGGRIALVTLRDGEDGALSTSVGRGGAGGDPGERGIEKVLNKQNFFVTTKTQTGYIGPNWQDGLWYHLLSKSKGDAKNMEWGWRRFYYGYSYDSDEFEKRIRPWLNAKDAEKAKLHRNSMGAPGTPGGGSGSGGGAAHAQQRKRQQNHNISAEDEYQRQKYQMVQTLRREEKFTSIENQYVSQELALQKQINSLSQQLLTTEESEQRAQQDVNRMQERKETLTNESQELEQQMTVINSVISKSASEIRHNDKIAMSKIISSLQQSETIAQLSQELQNISIDSKYDAKALARLQTIAAGIQALQLAKQIEIEREQEELEQQIAALQAEMLRTQQMMSQLANVSAVSSLDALLARTQALQQQQITQQQRKQKSVQVEADPDSDEIDHLEGTSILLSVRDTFARGEAPGSVWPALGNSTAKRAVEAILSAIPSVREDKRALTVELLEILTRYCIFTEDFTRLEDLIPLSITSEADTVVVEALKDVDSKLRWNHWFIGQMTGATIMITSSESATVDQASLTSRYEQVDGIPVFDSLTPLERSAAELVHELNTTGANLQRIAQFLNNYHDAILEAIGFTRQGYLSVLQGNPVKFIDKLSRIVLMFFRRSDDALAQQNLELAVGIRKTIRSVADAVGIYVLEVALTRKRDIRGGGGYTNLFLHNAEEARKKLGHGDLSGALVAMRNTKAVDNANLNQTTYGPRTKAALVAEIDSAVVSTSTAEIVTKLTTVARALGSGIAARSADDVMEVLTRVRDTVWFTGDNANMKNAAAWGPMAACATMGINLLSIWLSDGDKDAQILLHNAATNRLSVPYLPATERLSRVLAFFRFVSGGAEHSPAWKLVEHSGVVGGATAEENMNRNLFYSVLRREELHYPERSPQSEAFMNTLYPTLTYEDAMEHLAFNVITENPEYTPESGPWRRVARASMIGDVLSADPEESPAAEFLLQFALKSREEQIVGEMTTDFLVNAPTSLSMIRSYAQSSLVQVTSTSSVEKSMISVVKQILFGQEYATLHQIWKSACRSPKEADLMLLVISIMRSRDSASLQQLREQLKAVAELWYGWPVGKVGLDSVKNLLYEGTIAIVRAIAGNTVELAKSLETPKTSFVVEVLESALSVLAGLLSDPPADEDMPMQAKELNLLFCINAVIYQGHAEKQELSRTSTTDEVDNALLNADGYILNRLLMVCTAFISSDAAAMLGVLANTTVTSQVQLRAEISNALRNGSNLGSSELELAQGLYVAFIVRSSQRRTALLETEEVVEVARSLFGIWKDSGKDDSRTTGLALLQTLVLEVREKERGRVSSQFNQHASAQKTLIERVKGTLPTATASTNSKKSPALVSENNRKEQLWYIFFSQINDEELRSGLSEWTSIQTELQATADADDFEKTLAKRVNRLLYQRRSTEERAPANGMPDTLKVGTRSMWAARNWSDLNHLINVAKYDGVGPSGFDYNVFLQKIVGGLAPLLPEVEAKSKEEPLDEIVERGDAIAWLFDELAKSFEGMYVTSSDDELIEQLSTTVGDLSRRGEYSKASAKLQAAIEHLVSVLEHSNPSAGRYAKVETILDETYEVSELKRRLDGVDDSAVLSSKVVATCAQVGDFLHNRDQTTLMSFVSVLRADASFGELPTVYSELIDSEIAISREPSTAEEAIKVLLEVEDDSATDLPSFKTLASVCLLLQDRGDDVRDLVKAAYTAVLSKLSGEMQFVLGMAQESDFNPTRGSSEQMEATKEAYNEAAKSGSNNAYNNMLCNSFDEARRLNMTFDEARALVLPVFREIKSDAKAAANIAQLEQDKAPVQRYMVNSPADYTAEAENSLVFGKFEKSMQRLVKLMEAVIYAASSGDKDVMTLRHLLGERVDTLSTDLRNPDLERVCKVVEKFTTETMELIETAPPIKQIGGFTAALSGLYAGTVTSLNQITNIHRLLLAHENVIVMIDILFPSAGSTIVHNSTVMANSDARDFIQSLLPKIMTFHIEAIPTMTVSGKSLLDKFTEAAVSELESMSNSSDEDAKQAQQRASLMVDAMLFHSEDPLRFSELSLEDILTKEEKLMFEVCERDDSFQTVRKSDGTREHRAPFLWTDALSKQCILHLLQRTCHAKLTGLIANLRMQFNSELDFSEAKKPLTAAEDEVDKIQEAMRNIFDVEKIDSSRFSEQQFQNIFNASHYILYLTTAKYIVKVRGPPRPDVPLEKEDQSEADKRKLDFWDRFLFKPLEREANNMVKRIKAADQELLDAFGVARKVHQRLIVLDTVFPETAAEVYKGLDDLLNLPGSTIAAVDRALWLLEETDPPLVTSIVKKVMSSGTPTRTLTLDGFVLSVAFQLIEEHVGELCDMTSREGPQKTDALMRVATLQQQSLQSEGGVGFAKFVLTTTSRMIEEANADTATNAASKEEVESLLDSIQLAIDTQAWRSASVMKRLQLFSRPSAWVSVLDAFSIAMSLSYNPDSTSDEDTLKFERAAMSIQRLRSRRGTRITKVFLECLQLLIANHADASILVTISAAVASNRWPFSASSVPAYKHAAELPTSVEVVNYLEEVATTLKSSAGDRSVPRLVGIMREEVEGVNASVAHFLSPVAEGSATSEMEQRVQTIFDLADTHTNADGEVINDWSTSDIKAWSQEFKKDSMGYFNEDHTGELNVMLAVFTRAVRKYKEEDIRKPQLLSIIIFVDSMIKEKGQLAEIGTGEGKSLICLLCATARAFKGETVDIITSSPVLAERDAEEAAEWFKYFDMKVNNNCDSEAEGDPLVRQKRYHEHAIMYGTTGAFQRDILLTNYYNMNIRKKGGDCLIVDEVDTLFIDSVANTLFISHDIRDLKHLSQMFVSIWMAVQGPDVEFYSESSVQLVKRFIQSQIDKGNLRVPRWLHAFVDNRMDIWIRSAYNAKSMEEGDQYTLYETGRKRGQVVVVDLYTGVEMPSTQWSNGLHQFVQLKHNNKLSAESLKAIFLANVNFVKMYGHRVIGMTGTLGSQSELDLLGRVYGTTAFRMPRFREERYYEEPAIVLGNRARWLENVAEEVVVQSNNSEGFELQRTIDDAAYQEGKLKKDKKKVKEYTAKVASNEAEIERTEDLETSLLARTVEMTMPHDVDMRAVLALEVVISDLRESEFISKGDQSYGADRVNLLATAVSNMKSQLQSVIVAEAESTRLAAKVSDLELEQEKNSMLGNAPTTTTALDTAKSNKAAAEDEVLRLNNLTYTKGNAVLEAISSTQQGVSYLAEEHLTAVRKDLKKAERKLAKNEEDVVKRTLKLASSTDAIASGGGGRAVLVICRNKNDCEDIRDAIVTRREANVTLYVYAGTSEGITEVNQITGKAIRTHVPLNRVKPHDIIVATNIAGRGTSLKTTDVLEQCGGLHVVLSYVPSNVRVEVQAWGRTSRKGQNGSGRFVVYDPRVTSSLQDITIDYLLSERDTNERKRLEEIELETIPRVKLEAILFERFGQISKKLKASFKEKVDKDLQRKELRDQWAFFLETNNDALEDTYKHPKQTETQLLASLQAFEEAQSEAATGVFGLVSSPGNLLHVVTEALKNEDYNQARLASQEIIDTDKQYAGYGHYYHALSLFEDGTDNFQTKANALKELNKAVYLLKREADNLQAQSQVISSINGARQRRGEGTESKAFEKSAANTQSLIQVHISAAEKLTGRVLTEADFQTSAISGDATKQVFDIFQEEDKLRNYVRPLRIATTMEILLRVTATSAEEKRSMQFLREARGNVNRWKDDTLEVGNATDAELETVKKSKLSWELALYRTADEFETRDRSRIEFPSDQSYAVPIILENLRKMAQDGQGNPIPFSSVSEEKRSKIKETIFAPLLSKSEITAHLESIAASVKAEDYLVVEENYKTKAFGKWDAVGFCEVGDEIKTWFKEKAAVEKYILRSKVEEKAKALLEAKGGVADSEGDAALVANAIVSQGVAKSEKLRRLNETSRRVIEEDASVIAVKPECTNDVLEKLPFDGFPTLEKNASKIHAKLMERKGGNFSKTDFEKCIGSDVDDSIMGDSFLILQAIARSEGVASYLCERLGLAVPEHKRSVVDGVLSTLETTFDFKDASKVTTSSELQGRLLTQRVLDMPSVKIGIDGSSDIDTLTENIKTHLKDQIKTIAARVKVEDETTDEKTTAMLDDVVEAMKAAVTELASLKGTLKVDFETLTMRMSEDDEVPPELLDFISAATEITVKVVKVKTFADYWDWNAFAVALIGLVQIVAGAAILILTAGAATNIAGALIGEGIGDMMYAVTAGLTGTFSWKEYGIQKAISLAITVGVGLATAGIGTIVNKGSQVAAIAAKATIKAVVKAVAKKVAADVIKGALSYAIGYGADRLVEMAIKEVFKTFKSKFRVMAESNVMCKASVAKIKQTLGKLVDAFGAERAAKFVKDAVKDSAAGAGIDTEESRITGAVLKVAGELSNSLSSIGSRLEKSGSKYAKTIGNISKFVGYAAKAAGVADAVAQIVRYLPDMYGKLNTRLLGIESSTSFAPPKLSATAKEAWIVKQMTLASNAIYDKVEKITAKGIAGAAVKELVSKGMTKLYSKTVDKISKDYNELKLRAEASGAIKKLSHKSSLTKLERDQLVKLQTQLTDPKNKYPSILSTVDPVTNGDMKIMYKGRITTLNKVSDMFGTTGLQVLPLKTGNAGYFIKPKYEEYISGLSTTKQANKFDIHAMAKAAKVNVTLIHDDNGTEKRTKITPNEGDDVQTVNMKLLSTAEYPEGRYVLVDNDGNIKFKHEFDVIGSASAAQQILYAKSFGATKDHRKAIATANSEDDLDVFLADTRKQALGDKLTRATYLKAEYEDEPSILGGSSPHPNLPLVPVPRARTTVKRRRLGRTRGLRPASSAASKTVKAASSTKSIARDAKTDSGVTEKLRTNKLAVPVVSDRPVLARAVAVKPRGDVKLGSSVLRLSRSRGVISLKSDNLTLRRLVGTRVKRDERSRSSGTELVSTNMVQRPRVSYLSMQRIKETLKKYHLDADKPLRFLVETNDGDNALAIEIKGEKLRYAFRLDGVTGGGMVTWGNTPESALETFV